MHEPRKPSLVVKEKFEELE